MSNIIKNEQTLPAKRLKIYLAGPDVFYPDAVARAVMTRQIVESFGYDALIPLDADVKAEEGGKSITRQIYDKNIEMINRADVVMANLTAFRGVEPDSGTVFEIGYAVAKGKIVYSYDLMELTVLDRTVDYFNTCARARLFDSKANGDTVFPDGMKAEAFNMTHNLMLMHGVKQVHGDLSIALQCLTQALQAEAIPA